MTAFVEQIRVQFNETDAMGVVHHANYVNYVERARVEFLRARGLSYREITERGFHLAVVEIQFKYRSPAHFDDLLDVEVSLSHLGRASADFAFVIRRAQQLICEGVTKLACVTKDAKLRPIPEDARQLLSS